MLLKARLLFESNQVMDAKSIVDNLIRSDCYNTQALYWRSRCQYKLGDRGNCLNDLYQSRGCFFSSHTCLTDWESEKTATQQIVSEFITSPQVASIKKAYCFREAADSIVNEDERKKFLRLSLDAASSIKEGENEVEALYMCFDVCLGLKATEAESFLNRIDNVDGDQIRVEIAKLRLNQSKPAGLDLTTLFSIPQLAKKIGEVSCSQPAVDSYFYRFIDSKSKLLENQEFLFPKAHQRCSTEQRTILLNQPRSLHK
jgi:hypothetical protein